MIRTAKKLTVTEKRWYYNYNYNSTIFYMKNREVGQNCDWNFGIYSIFICFSFMLRSVSFLSAIVTKAICFFITLWVFILFAMNYITVYTKNHTVTFKKKNLKTVFFSFRRIFVNMFLARCI